MLHLPPFDLPASELVDRQQVLDALYTHEVLNHKLIWAWTHQPDLTAFALYGSQGVLVWDGEGHLRLSAGLTAADLALVPVQPGPRKVEGPLPVVQGYLEANPNVRGSLRRSWIYTLDDTAHQQDREFRRLRADDVEAAQWLIEFNRETQGRELTHAQALQMLYASHREFYILEHRQKAAAVAGIHRWTRNRQCISFVYVPPRFRGLGFGFRLMASLGAFILNVRKRQVMLFADPANTGANVLYQKLGYRQVGQHALLTVQ